MKSALNSVNRHKTVQTEPANSTQVKNNAGGYVFEVSPKSRLERFLIIGTDGGTYYTSETTLTRDNVSFVTKLIQEDEALVLSTVLDVSTNGRAYRNSPALFTIALLLVDGKNKSATAAALPKVARTATMLFELVQYIENLGGWGRAKKNAVASWYETKAIDDLAYQLVKYRQRNGWTHRDVMRLSHPKGVDSNLVNFALGKEYGTVPEIITGFNAVQATETSARAVEVLKQYTNLPWETIPTQHLKDLKVWKTLFYNGQLNGQALLRNITRLARLNAFTDLKFTKDYCDKLTDAAMIEKTRLHPIQYLNAIVVHTNGQTDRKGYYRRTKDWDSSPMILDALQKGFYQAFKSVVPAGKRTFLALDVSSSMNSPAPGTELSCAQVAGAVAMTIARTEPMYCIAGFTSNGHNGWYNHRSGNTQLTQLNINASTNLNAAFAEVQKNNFGSTDCSLPILSALESKMEIDTFVVLTDNETYAGSIHPFQALKKYRKEMGIDAKLAVFGVSATNFSIADPSDLGMMDFVGFDSNAPKVLADFSAGRI